MSELRLLELLLLREVGGVGYDKAIEKYSKEYPEYYEEITNKMNAQREE